MHLMNLTLIEMHNSLKAFLGKRWQIQLAATLLKSGKLMSLQG